MKHKKAVLLGLMGLFLAGGIGTTLAMTYKDANVDISGQTDSAIYLKWGDNNDIAAITDLTSGTPVYRDVVLNAQQSTNAGNNSVAVTFKLFEPSDKQVSMAGISFKVFYDTDNQGGFADTGTTGCTELSAPTSQEDGSFILVDKVDFVENVAKRSYRIEITYDGSQPLTTKTSGARMTINLAKAA